MLLEIHAAHWRDFCSQEGDGLVGISDIIYLPSDKHVTLAVQSHLLCQTFWFVTFITTPQHLATMTF